MTLFSFLSELLHREGIELFGSLPFERVRITRPHLLERMGFSPRGVLLFCVPYAVSFEEGNLSLYARSLDYHGYMKELEARLSASLSSSEYGDVAHRLFSDHSPIDERHAAALAGLGVLGENGLLLTREYGSYVFLGELLLDRPLPDTGDGQVHRCEGCGACRRACPTGALSGEGECLSALTQKKGELSPEAVCLMKKTGSIWGCDLCQTACPHNRGAKATDILYFKRERLSSLTEKALLQMSDEELSRRAFSFRGRAVPLRNLRALAEANSEEK